MNKKTLENFYIYFLKSIETLQRALLIKLPSHLNSNPYKKCHLVVEKTIENKNKMTQEIDEMKSKYDILLNMISEKTSFIENISSSSSKEKNELALKLQIETNKRELFENFNGILQLASERFVKNNELLLISLKYKNAFKINFENLKNYYEKNKNFDVNFLMPFEELKYFNSNNFKDKIEQYNNSISKIKENLFKDLKDTKIKNTNDFASLVNKSLEITSKILDENPQISKDDFIIKTFDKIAKFGPSILIIELTSIIKMVPFSNNVKKLMDILYLILNLEEIFDVNLIEETNLQVAKINEINSIQNNSIKIKFDKIEADMMLKNKKLKAYYEEKLNRKTNSILKMKEIIEKIKENYKKLQEKVNQLVINQSIANQLSIAQQSNLSIDNQSNANIQINSNQLPIDKVNNSILDQDEFVSAKEILEEEDDNFLKFLNDDNIKQQQEQQEESKKINDLYEVLKNEHEDLKNIYNALKNDNEALKNDNEEIMYEIKELKTKIEKLEVIKTNQTSIINQKFGQIKNLENELVNNEKINEQLSKENKELKEKISIIESENEILKKDKTSYDLTNNELLLKNEQLSSKNLELDNFNKELKKNNTQINENNIEILKENSFLKGELKENTSNYNNLLDEFDRKKSEYNQLKLSFTILSEKIKQVGGNFDNTSDTSIVLNLIEENKQKVDELSIINNFLVESIEKMNSFIEGNLKFRSEIINYIEKEYFEEIKKDMTIENLKEAMLKSYIKNDSSLNNDKKKFLSSISTIVVEKNRKIETLKEILRVNNINFEEIDEKNNDVKINNQIEKED